MIHTTADENAFPISRIDKAHNSGMTMREWYAGMALQGLLADCGTEPDDQQPISAYQAEIARAAFGYADAMLAEAPKEAS